MRVKSSRPQYDGVSIFKTWEMGMLFDNRRQFKEAIQKYSIKRGLDVRLKRNEAYRVCIDRCPLRVYSNQNSILNAFQIKSLKDQHKCFRTDKLKIVIVEFIANKLRGRIIGQLSITQKQLVKICLEHLKVYVSASLLSKARAKVLQDHYGQCKVEYTGLQDYVEELKLSNPRSTIDCRDIDVNGVSRFFKFIFILQYVRMVGLMEANQ